MASGQRTTLTDTNVQRRAVTDMISMIDPTEVPLCAYLGWGAGTENKFQLVNWPGHKVEWLEDTLTTRSATANSASLTSDSTLTQITVTTNSGAVFQPGNVIKIDSEYIWISSISSDVLTVTRNYGGTQATHASDATVTLVTTARLEGDDADDSYSTTTSTAYNHTQIFQRTVNVSRSQAKNSQYGIEDEYMRQVQKYIGGGNGMGGRGRAGVLPIELEKALFEGVRKTRTATLGGAMGGLDWFLNTSNNAGAHVQSLTGSPALTQKHIEDEIQNCWDDGGYPNLIVCGGWAKRKITSFWENPQRYERSSVVGGMIVERIMTEFGELDILLNRWCPSTSLYLLDTDYIGILPFDDFFEQELAVDGDYAKGQVVGEYTFIMGHCNAVESAHAKITGFSTSK